MDIFGILDNFFHIHKGLDVDTADEPVTKITRGHKEIPTNYFGIEAVQLVDKIDISKGLKG